MFNKINNLKFKWLIVDNLKANQEAIIACLIQKFEADFLEKVSLKILNLVFILKTFIYDDVSS